MNVIPTNRKRAAQTASYSGQRASCFITTDSTHWQFLPNPSTRTLAQHPPPPSQDLRLRYMFFRLLSSLSFRTTVTQVASNSAARRASDIDKLPLLCPCWMPTQYRPTRLAKRTNVATTPPWSSYSLPPRAPQHPQHSVL